MPIQGVQAIFILKNRRFFCMNAKCNHKFFAERFDFIKSYAKKSNRLKEKILEMSIYLSFVSACEILNSNFIKICKSTVFNIFKDSSQKKLLISELTHICIDDFALKKAKTYGTVMIDCNTHRIVDMIDSREVSNVKAWLELYTNIQVVCRDGSIGYNRAISEAHPNALQVNDRFHLFKNLTSYIKKYLQSKLPNKVPISYENKKIQNVNIIDEVADIKESYIITLEEKYNERKIMKEKLITKTKICKDLNIDIRTYDKLDNVVNEEELNCLLKNRKQIIQEEKITSKLNLSKKIKEMKNKGLSKRTIAKNIGIDRRTVSKYLSDNFNPIHTSFGQKRERKLTPSIIM